jgi:hypothetical protein
MTKFYTIYTGFTLTWCKSKRSPTLSLRHFYTIYTVFLIEYIFIYIYINREFGVNGVKHAEMQSHIEFPFTLTWCKCGVNGVNAV